MMKSGYSDANPIDKKLAYESEVENIVIGFSEDQEPIWLEILDVTKDFLPKLNKIKKISNHQRIFYSTKIIEICSCSAICLKFPSKVKKWVQLFSRAVVM